MTLSLTRILGAAALTLGAVGATSVAHARSDVQVSIGFGVPGVYVQPQPVYSQPYPVYTQPRPVYVQPHPVYVQPRPVYVQPAPVYYGRGYQGHGQGYGYGYGRWEDRGHRNGPWGDRDGDGVANRYDRDRDGDGVRNNRDRAPQDRYRY